MKEKTPKNLVSSKWVCATLLAAESQAELRRTRLNLIEPKRFV
jgi:hypothetical protein